MAGSLVITEKWIKEKLNLKIDNLDVVRSLTLPGTYHQKITHLGRSLLTFTRLKHLDLSRNALESLEGLDHLKGLETLNIYYNNVPDLKEVFRLRHNTHLKEIDIRLNPLTQSSPDYRLFIIHMLLRLQILDDRKVTDEERKAALLYFDTDQAYELDRSIQKENAPPPVKDSTPKTNHVQARVALTQSIAPLRSGLGTDTEELLKLFAERGDHLFTTGHTPTHSLPSQPLRRKILKATTPSPEKRKKPTGKQRNSSPTDTHRQPGYHFTPHPSAPMDTLKTETRLQTKDKLLDDKEREIVRLREQVRLLEERPEKELLQAAHRDMVELQKQCQALLDENAVLRETEPQKDFKSYVPNNASIPPTIKNSDMNIVLSDIVNQQDGIKETLSQVSHSLSQLLSHSSQLQSVVVMLQESHKSLVSSNHRLGQELAETKERHSQEVAQISKNYNTLRSLVQERLHI